MDVGHETLLFYTEIVWTSNLKKNMLEYTFELTKVGIDIFNIVILLKLFA